MHVVLVVTQCSREVFKRNAEIDRKPVAMRFQRARKNFGGVSFCPRVIVQKQPWRGSAVYLGVYRTACVQDNTKQCRQKSMENK